MPTLNALINAGARVVVCSHLGRPDGAPDPQYSLEPVAQRLSELLGAPVAFARDTVGESAQEAVASLEDGGVVVIENLRFNAGETSKDDATRAAFAAELATLGDVLVSDGFGVVHRKQASVYELAELLPSAAGLLIAAELDVLDRLTENPERPYAVVLGGSKVSDKLGVISHLLPRVDRILVGGGMLFTFLKAQGHAVASSLLEEDQLETCSRLHRGRAAERGVELVLPTDVVVAASFGADAAHEVAAADAIESTPFGASGIGLDIGPATAERFAEVIRESKTVFWNGPMGVFEFPAFAAGHQDRGAGAHRGRRPQRWGGGDSAAARASARIRRRPVRSHLDRRRRELEFLEGKKLPGLEVLGWA